MTGQLLTLEAVVDSWGIADSEHDRQLFVRWLGDQIRAKKITARKIRRRWYLNPADQAAAIEAFANRQAMPALVDDDSEPATPHHGISAASLKMREAS